MYNAQCHLCKKEYQLHYHDFGRPVCCDKCGNIFYPRLQEQTTDEMVNRLMQDDGDEQDGTGPYRLSAAELEQDRLAAVRRQAVPYGPPQGQVARTGLSQTAHQKMSAPAPHAPVQDDPLHVEDDAEVDDRTYGSPGFWQSVLWTVLFPSDPHNLIRYVTLSMLVGILVIVGLEAVRIFAILIFPFIVISSYYAFEVVHGAASGEEKLPDIELTDGFYPLLTATFRYCMVWVGAMAPLIIFTIFTSTTDHFPLGSILFDPSYRGFVSEPVYLTLALLLVYGIFVWPMMFLWVAMEGLQAMWRPDLMVRSIVGIWFIYIPVALLYIPLLVLRLGLLLVLAEFLSAKLSTAWQASKLPMAADSLALLVGSMLAALVIVYTEIVMLRLVGLMYHHFKHRFARQWG